MGAGTRVLMTADAVGGVWQYAMQLSSSLVRRGAVVMLATMGREPSVAQRAEAAAAGIVLETSTFALEWMPDAWTDVDRAGEWLSRLGGEFAADVVHLNGYCHAALPWRAPVVVVAHSCVCSWWQAVHGTCPPSEWQEYIRRVTDGLRAAARIVTPSHAMADALVRCYFKAHAATPEITTIANAVEPRRRATRAKEPVIFAAGRVWDPAKNLTVLDTAAAHVPWPVVVAGDLTTSGSAAPPMNNARCLGPLPASGVSDWMERAAIYALPARYEPFGLSILEAAHAGCALVLGDIPSLRENWEGAALFVHPDQPDDLQRSLQDLIDRPAAREALSLAARRRADTFSPARQATAYERLYQEMMAGHGRAADSPRTH